MRLLFWLILGGLIYFAIRSKVRGWLQENVREESKPFAEPVGKANPALEQGESMLACAHCSVYFPASEAVRVGKESGTELIFCCDAHRQQHGAPHD